MKTILAIDDLKDNLITIKALLKNYLPDCLILTAQSGIEGIEIARKEQPDTILLDIIMPHMDGYQVCQKLKEDELTKNIPVIMLSAIRTDMISKIKGLHVGADAFFAKPIEPNELTAQIKVMFRIKNAEDKLRMEKDELDSKVKERTKELEESEKKHRTIIENTSEGFWLLNPEGKAIEVNQSLCDMLGYSDREILGKTPLNFVDEDNGKIFQEQISQESKLLHRTYEISLKNKKGENIPTIFNATSLFDKDKKFVGTFAFISDITERKRVEEELQKIDKLESIGTLAGGIAHDFNNILTGIYGNVFLAERNLPKNHLSISYLVEAQKSMERATKLTNQLLTFSKGGALIKENVSLSEIIRDVVKFDLSGSSVKPVFNIPENLWNAGVDKGQIGQVFSNLTINANQASPDGGHLFITMENVIIEKKEIIDLLPGNYVKISIQDEGSGIEKKNLDKIFDPYFTTKETGNGLGLATSFSIIKKHNGHIEIESKLGKGTTFTIYLPALVACDTEGNKEITAKKVLPAETGRVLIMDDEEMIRLLVVELLKELKFTAETVSSGEEAVKRYKESIKNGNPFDLIIMDLTIPGGMGGKEAIGHILAINPKAKVIVSSGYSYETVNYKKLGFCEIISKPYTISRLEEVLQKVLSNG